MTYQRDPVKAPRLAGVALRAFVGTIESGVGPAVLSKITTDSGLERFRETPVTHASPIQVPLPLPEVHGSAVQPATVLAQKAIEAPAPSGQTRFETVADFNKAYRAGTHDPLKVVRRLHEHIEKLDGRDDRMGFFIARKPDEVLAAAQASTDRWREGKPLSALDGVPVVIKDEMDLEGFATTLGTKFFKTIATTDSTVVARLKAAGALILGKANMNEIGINPIGLNPHHGPARNPWNRGHITGGSSSASAAVVAAGLCPVAIGADGGGSIRIPAGLCGVVGLKATFGRISEAGVPPLCWNVGHVGPIGATVADVAAAYTLLAGPDPRDPVSLHQGPLHLSDFTETSLKGLRIGICTPYFNDAEPDVVRNCREALKALTDAGAVVTEIPPPDLNTILWSHATIILSEMTTAMLPHLKEDSSRFALDSRTNLAIGRQFRATDLVHAMRHRHQLTREYLELMKNVDVIITPTTATTAPKIPEASLPDGESNLVVTDSLMRFVRVGNLTGFPAIALPAGYDTQGLPVSVQLLARPYEEHLLLRLGRVVEAAMHRRVPQMHVTALR